jgi:formate hydrogenlyase transcriptional activator
VGQYVDSHRELRNVVERAHIVKVLDDCDWKIRGTDGAAERLGLNRSTLQSRMKKMGIQRPAASGQRPAAEGRE